MRNAGLFTILTVALVILLCQGGKAHSESMGTAFTYQGRLLDANEPADGLYDFLFLLFDEPYGDALPLASDVNEMDVNDGYFTVELDFGGSVFDGDARWLQIGVRPGDLNDPNDYTILSPRQEVTPTPYSIYAKSAGGDNDWMLSGNDMYSIPSGNVGIGATGPGDKLDVDGNINSSESYKLDGDIVLANTGTNNIFVGKDAATSITSGRDNSAVGYLVLHDNNEGNYNSAMGSGALRSNTTGQGNSAMGFRALFSNTTSPYNSAMGYYALALNTTGGQNTAMGYGALYSNTTANNNSAMGAYALSDNTTGYYNSAMGFWALRSNTTGNYNSAMGSYALSENTTGYYNSAMGCCALYSNSTGYQNTAMGYFALYANTTGNYNSAMGNEALFFNTTGYQNTAMGYGAGYNNSTGSANVFLGYKAGYNETGSEKLYIANGPDDANCLIYGDFATIRVGINRVPAKNEFEVEGNASKTTAGDWQANSDARIKTDIQTVTGALDTLDKVRLVSFNYTDDYRDAHSSVEDRRYFNVIAQEFRKVFPDYVRSSGEKLPDGDEILQVDAYPLTVYSAAAVQELHNIVKAKDAEIIELKERVSQMEALLANLLDEQEGE